MGSRSDSNYLGAEMNNFTRSWGGPDWPAPEKPEKEIFYLTCECSEMEHDIRIIKYRDEPAVWVSSCFKPVNIFSRIKLAFLYILTGRTSQNSTTGLDAILTSNQIKDLINFLGE